MSKSRSNEVRYHFIFWMIYILLWSARDFIYHPNIISNILLNLVFSLSVVPFIYFNIFLFVPKFLFKKKWSLYALFFGTGFLLSLGARYFIYQFVFRDILGVLETAERFSSGEGLVILASENMILITITMALFLIREYYVKETYTHELEQKNIESELNMLKSQLQPHFLFNNLNTIYFLMETNPSLAREVMIQFSDVLSHQLYNAKKDKVLLKDELESLKNFLKLQQVRHEDFLDLKYSFPENVGTFQIAPMILLTFIENAFKHGQTEEGYFIHINLKLEGAEIYLQITNSNGEKQKEKLGGVGLDNVKRRLSLIYSDRHKLTIEDKKEIYIVNLTMTLDQNEQT